jgi:hypothetical protein
MRLECTSERVRAGQEQAGRGGRLPKGFTPIPQMKTLFYMGKWPILEDGSPGFFPTETVLAMGKRDSERDADAKAWLDLFDAATHGDAASQLELGKVCETGALGAPKDVQRALFWYYRAALQGNRQAQEAAQRLERALDIDPGAIAEPALIHEGPWIFVMDNFGQGVTRNLFDLQAGGAVEGRVLDVGGDAFRTINRISRFEPGPREFLGNLFMGVRYEGRWDYDPKGLILTFLLDTSIEGIFEPGPSVTLQIELLGCNESVLFGRDRKQAGYTLQPAVGEQN